MGRTTVEGGTDVQGHDQRGTIARQCLDAGLLDEVHVDLVPVILGGGTPFFSSLKDVPVELAGPDSVVEGTGVTHLRYRVVRGG